MFINRVKRAESHSRFLLLGLLLYALAGSVAADTQSCTGLSSYLCGGLSPNTPVGERCLPHVKGIQAHVIRVEVLSTFPIVQKRLTLNVSAHGRGFHTYGTADFRLSIYSRVDDYAPQLVASRASSSLLPWDAYAVCTSVGASASCYTVVVTSSTQALKFWARAWQRSSEGYDLCGCNGDTVRFASPINAQVGDFAAADVPLASELGPSGCESSVGDPINAVNGNMYFLRQDLAVPSDLGLPMSFTREYNSYPYADAGSLRGGWRHGFEFSLSSDDSLGIFRLTEASGRVVEFRRHDLVQGAIHQIRYDAPYGIPYRFGADTVNGIYRITREDDSKLVFHGLGPVDSIQDIAGNAITLFYGDSLLDSARNASGRTLAFLYDTMNLVAVAGDAGDTLVRFQFDSSGSRLRRATYSDGSWEQYDYGDEWYDQDRIVEIIDSDGLSRSYAYDSVGRAIQYFTGDSSERADLAWSEGRTVADCSPNPPLDTTACNVSWQGGEFTTAYLTVWAPDASRRIVARIADNDCGSCATKYQYDPGGMKRAMTYANGVVDSAWHDNRANMIGFTRGANSSTRQQLAWSFDSTFNRPVTGQRNSIAKSNDVDKTLFTYDAKGSPTRIVETGWKDAIYKFNDTSWFSYNSKGQLTKSDGPRRDIADTTKYVYFDNGDLRYSIAANGDTTEFGQRDQLGRRTWTRSPNGDTTRFLFDTRGRLSRLISLAGTADSLVESFTYTVSGNLKSANKPKGGVTSFHFTSAGYVDSVADPVGSFLRYSYDSLGHPVSRHTCNGNGTLRHGESYGYDVKHEMTRVVSTYGDTTRLGYSPVGTLDTIWDPLSHRTLVRRDSLRRVLETVQPNSGDSIKSQYTYDKHDNVTKFTDPNGYQYVFRFDDKDRLLFDSCAATDVTRYGYDAADNLVWKKNAVGDSVAFKYDALNRLTAVLFPDSQNVRFKYDGTEFSHGRGRLYMDSTASCWVKYQYDALGRVYLEIRKFAADTATYTTTFHYDKNDNVDTLTYPTGRIVAYACDSTDNVTQVRLYHAGQWTTLVDSVRYAPFGDAESWWLGNGMRINVGIDSAYRTDSIGTLPDSVSSITYGYNAVGDITSVTNRLDTAANRNLTYDDTYRLIAARSRDYPDTLKRYIYARNGNRDTVFSHGASGVDTAIYTYTGNKLTQVSGADGISFSYDATGNVIQEVRGADTLSLQYNDAAMLTGVSNSAVAAYSYDALYRRVKKVTAGGTTTRYVPANSGQLLTEYGVTGGWNRDYIYLNGQLVARVSSVAGEGVQYVVNDHQGTPIALVDSAKTVRWKAKWYPFGEIYSETVSATNDVRFPGQLRDDESGLYYNWHRYYGPTIGRYYQADPLGLYSGDYNLYRYADGNPTRYTDPDGRAVPLLLAAYGIYELGSTLFDIWTATTTILDDCASDEEREFALGGLVAGALLPGGGYGTAGKALVKGQMHHAISRKVFAALQKHDVLVGVYRLRDSRLATRAKNLMSHIGYQSWHRQLDAEVVSWLAKHPAATRSTFERFLRSRYSDPDLLSRFPRGF